MNGCIWRGLILALAATPGCAMAQTGFEGAVSMNMQAKGQSFPVDFSIKGHKARVEMQTLGHPSIVLIDFDSHEQIILIPELKSYMVHGGDQQGKLSTSTPPKITRLGTTETFAGHTCQDYRLESEKYSGTACMTKEFGDNPLAAAMNGPLGSALSGDEALKKAGMPLKVTLTFNDGDKQGDTATVEVTRIAQGAVDDAEFLVPNGWHKLSGLSGMPK